MAKQKNKTKNMIFAAMFLALAIVLPLLTANTQILGNQLCLMHIPVILCGFFCGPVYGMVVGLIAPLLRFAIFSMPSMPLGIAMCFELATYGAACGILFHIFPKKNIFIYVTLILAMIAGRIVWAFVRLALFGVIDLEFTWTIFLTSGFLIAIPGIIIQIILIPIIVIALKKYTNEYSSRA